MLGNIYLDALDKEWESRGVAFCRYADDVTLYAGSRHHTERILESLTKWIERNLKLEINREKSGVRPPDEGSLLGFRIEKSGKIARSQKSIKRFKRKVRDHWGNPRSKAGRKVLESWRKFVHGETGYYRLSERSWD